MEQTLERFHSGDVLICKIQISLNDCGADCSVNFRLWDRAERSEKIEIATLVGLPDMLRIKRAVPARIAWRGLRPGGAAAGEFLVRHMQVDAPRRHVDLDLIACLHEGER